MTHFTKSQLLWNLSQILQISWNSLKSDENEKAHSYNKYIYLYKLVIDRIICSDFLPAISISDFYFQNYYVRKLKQFFDNETDEWTFYNNIFHCYKAAMVYHLIWSCTNPQYLRVIVRQFVKCFHFQLFIFIENSDPPNFLFFLFGPLCLFSDPPFDYIVQ